MRRGSHVKRGKLQGVFWWIELNPDNIRGKHHNNLGEMQHGDQSWD
jgi:hypothetical protein